MFESLTVIIPASNETQTLTNTVDGVLDSGAYDDISRIVLFLKSENCPSAEVAKELLRTRNCDKMEIVIQKTSTYNDAFKEIPHLVKSSHFLVLVSDGEMDPRTIEELVPIAKEKPESIVCGSKWHKDSVVENAPFIQSLGSKTINRFAALVFGVKATDIFSIFQIYPLELYKKTNASIAEFTLKPLRLGVEYIEIPTIYKREKDRESNFNFSGFLKMGLGYLKCIFRIRFTPKDKI
ncbi:MAG: glycosyltransferase [Clostridia bacterium]|nr:glycosyltransferase [Clostridia bacterium]